MEENKDYELTPSQKAKKKYYLKHRLSDDEYFKDIRTSLNDFVEIPNHPNYEINKDGDVYFKGGYSKDHKRRKPKFIKKTLNKIGYYIVRLDRETYFLHRLLAELFIQNNDNKTEVDHIDGNPQNNSLSNLRWVTHKENLNNPISIEREIKSHLGKESNIKGRKKVWVDKNNGIYKMI